MSGEQNNLLVLLLQAWLWTSPLLVFQVVNLMTLDDDKFKSLGDKTRWMIILIALPIGGVAAFTLWRISEAWQREAEAAAYDSARDKIRASRSRSPDG